MERLGVSFNGLQIDGKLDSQFTNGLDVFFVPDPCHMVKLARNALADLWVMIDGEGRVIKWDHIVQLQEVQKSEGLNFANKLGQRHISFHRLKMKVNIAAQTLSRSVDDAISFLKDCNVPEFQDADGTIEFCYQIDRLFDLLNSKAWFASEFKRPVTVEYISEWKSHLDSACIYLSQLKATNGLPIINHRRKTFVRGFIMASKSVSSIASELLFRPEIPSDLF
jgi:hypothetical protein